MEYGLVVVWLVAYLGLGAAALPVAATLLGRLPDRGAGVAMPLALVLVSLPAYWVGQVAFGVPALLAGLVVLGAASIGALRWADPDFDWRAAGDTAAVFAIAFGFMVAARAVDPAVHPILGEKFLDFGLLKALLRAPALPPEDFWFAGEPVAYYYGGHMMAALLSILTGTTANYAYNLALAGFYAMFVTAAYGVAGALGEARGATRRGAGLAGAFFVAFASNLATPARAIAGFLPPSLLASVAPEKAETFARGLSAFSYWPASRAMRAQVITEFPLFAWLNGDMHAHMMSPPFALLVVALLVAYHRTPEADVRRRRLLVFGGVPVVGGLLAFVSTWATFTPAGLTALALYFAPSDPTTLLPEPVGRRLRALADGAATERPAADGGSEGANGGEPVAAGDDPLRVLLASAERTLRVEGVRGATAAAGAATVLVVGLLFVLPFLLGSASTREVAVWNAARRSQFGSLVVAHGGFLLVVVAFLRERLAPRVAGNEALVLLALGVPFVLALVHDFAALGILGPLMLVAWLLLRGAPGDATRPDSERDGSIEGLDDQDRSRLETAVLGVGNAVQTVGVNLVLLALAYFLVDTVVGFAGPVLALALGGGVGFALADVGLTAVGTIWLLTEFGWPAMYLETGAGPPAPARALDRVAGFETVLFVAGAGLVLIVELVYVVEYAAPGRFNTVFKTYSQVWALWAPAAGAMFAVLVGKHLPAAAVGGTTGSEDVGPSLQSRFAVGAALLLVLSLSLYGGLALSSHFTGTSVYPDHQRVADPTLNATAFVQESHPEEAAAIRWLDRRRGTPTIVTAPGLYRWQAANGEGSNAPASLTGLPTVIGWPHHERGFRGPDAGIDERVADVRTIYTGPTDQRACLLATYDVEYVYVGPAERAKYGINEVVAVARVPGVGLHRSFSDGAVHIYRVDQDELPSGGTC